MMQAVGCNRFSGDSESHPLTTVYWAGLLSPRWCELAAKSCSSVQTLVSLGHTGRRVVLGHTLNTLWHVITKKKSHNVLSRFTILCWTPFTAIPNLMQPMGCRLVSPGTASSLYWRIASTGVWQEPLTQSKLHQPIGNDSYINSKICSLCLNGGTTLQGNVIPSSLETRLTETGSVHLNYCPSFCF